MADMHPHLFPANANLICFMICYAVALVAFALVGRWYLWPNIKDRASGTALAPLLLYSCLRINGLMFLVPGLVSPDLPSAFAVPVALGDATAVFLALAALVFIRTGSVMAIPAVWLFNIEGTLDLLYANYATFANHVDPAWLGASWYLAAVNVPAQLVVHALIFLWLLRMRGEI